MTSMAPMAACSGDGVAMFEAASASWTSAPGLDGSVDVVYDKKNVWVVCVVIDHPSSRTGPHVGPREEGRTRACTTSEPMKFMCMDCVRPAVADRSILLL
ncbi:unnamed protein product [Triticum turgidum subsp. durum]|uniref:Uncharacterized protein n=1 Tax=Triticum turgidum subsp. durum TaxID=4567 RepID=A0A9R1AX41_TRITD|nr:unnamed protein product [Triticum turgidum subsp. durum]